MPPTEPPVSVAALVHSFWRLDRGLCPESSRQIGGAPAALPFWRIGFGAEDPTATSVMVTLSSPLVTG